MSVARGSFLGKYELLSLLGSGGMAEVWKARIAGPAGFERTVVIKRILPHRGRDQTFVQMFLSEARLSALLHHPNIVQVYELGEADDEYFMAMEYVRGHDLGRVLRELRRRHVALPIGLGVLIVREICRALGHAHALTNEQGAPLQIIHRDVSPSNVMLGQEGTVKLLDFGVAKALGVSTAPATESGSLKGKMGYMSPEQVDGSPIGPGADLFAAGVILHELLTDRRLFKGESDFQTLSMVRAAVVAPPSSLNPDVPPDLDEVCLRALAHAPASRFSSGDEMANALEPFVGGWNNEQLRTLLKDLFADAEPGDEARTLTGHVTPDVESRVSSDGIPPRRRVRWGIASAGLAIPLGIALFAVRYTRPVSTAQVEPTRSVPLIERRDLGASNAIKPVTELADVPFPHPTTAPAPAVSKEPASRSRSTRHVRSSQTKPKQGPVKRSPDFDPGERPASVKALTRGSKREA